MLYIDQKINDNVESYSFVKSIKIIHPITNIIIITTITITITTVRWQKHWWPWRRWHPQLACCFASSAWPRASSDTAESSARRACRGRTCRETCPVSLWQGRDMSRNMEFRTDFRRMWIVGVPDLSTSWWQDFQSLLCSARNSMVHLRKQISAFNGQVAVLQLYFH